MSFPHESIKFVELANTISNFYEISKRMDGLFVNNHYFNEKEKTNSKTVLSLL